MWDVVFNSNWAKFLGVLPRFSGRAEPFQSCLLKCEVCAEKVLLANLKELAIQTKVRAFLETFGGPVAFREKSRRLSTVGISLLAVLKSRKVYGKIGQW